MRKPEKSNVSQAAKVLGSEGGRKGGPARAEVLTAAQRREIARKGGQASARKKT
jgi:general stress protein YciG